MKKSRSTWDRWIYPLSKDVDTTFCSAVVAELSSGGPESEFLSNLYKAGDLRGIVEHKICFHTSLVDYRSASQIQALFKKDRDLDLGFDPLRAAWAAFIKAERQCQEVNQYFGLTPPLPLLRAAISLAREKIRAVLGPVPPLKRLRPRFGPGSSTSIKRSDACFENKLSRTLVCSSDMFSSVQEFLVETPEWTQWSAEDASTGRVYYAEGETPLVDLSWSCNVPLVIDVGTLTFVEKNAKTDRPIVIEPVLNGFWQLGVGDYIKERLRVHANQDLRDQQRNRDLARRGSIDGSLATIDLSSASDTIAFSVVFDLLPEPWVDLLSKLRTGVITYAGLNIELEKFSSMGNGYTFELESLIFWALAASCTELLGEGLENVSVYGDDIIVPTTVVESLSFTLGYCGFTVNPDKTFCSGPFRESCGADWLNGEDVRPIFKKERLSLQWLFLFHNWALRRGELSLASIARAFIPEAFQLFGPDGYGDGHLLGSYELKYPRRVRRNGWEGGYFTTFKESSSMTVISHRDSFLHGLYDLYSRGPTEWWEPRSQRARGTVPGTCGVVKASLYTLSEHIFAR